MHNISLYAEYIKLGHNEAYTIFRMQTDKSIGPNCSFEMLIILYISYAYYF